MYRFTRVYTRRWADMLFHLKTTGFVGRSLIVDKQHRLPLTRGDTVAKNQILRFITIQGLIEVEGSVALWTL